MAIEVEAKHRIADVAAFRRRLADAGIPLGPPEAEDDVYFAHARHDFAARDEALRLRRDARGLELTFKGPRQGAGAKRRVEESVRLQGDPTALLGLLGYSPAARVSKRRESGSWKEVAIALDDVTGLGWFVELECMAEPGAEDAAAARIASAAAGLGLEGPGLRESYLELLTSRGRSPRARAP